MPLPRYTLLTLPGSAAWCFGLAAAGWLLGAHWEDFHHAFRYAEYAVVGVIGLAAALGLLKVRSRRRDKQLARAQRQDAAGGSPR
jgi:membrane protein DedA with SNARE-associated domain